MKEVKNQLGKENFYLTILNAIKTSTNLNSIQEKFGISKQNLNYYIRQLRNHGMILRKGKGHYEVVKSSKNSTKYGNFLVKDTPRGHAFVWNIKLPKEIKDWNRRIEILESKGINHKLVGILKNIPRIKALGRKVWLCNDHLRIFDKKSSSYFGNNAIGSRRKAFLTLLEIISALENKLGFIFKPFDFSINREHYALIKNDLAIDHNKKGIVLRVSDETGEWLLIDDSLGEGGELETIGKDAFKTNLQLQEWWNEHKETKFKVTPNFILKGFNTLTQSQSNQTKQIEAFAVALNRHIPAYEGMSKHVGELKKEIKHLRTEISKINKKDNRYGK